MKSNKPWKMSLIEGLQLRGVMMRKYIFCPPNPPQYAFEEYDQGYQFRLVENGTIIKPHDDVSIGCHILNDQTTYCPLIHLQRNTKQSISYRRTQSNFTPQSSRQSSRANSPLVKTEQCLQMDPAAMIKDRVLIIYSHGNASDLGDVFHFGSRICLEYNVDFLGYDYTGYGIGIQKYECSEKQTYTDLQGALSFAVNDLQYPLNHIILWGYSLGSGPTTEIASRYPSLGGVILQAPLASIYIWLDKHIDNLKYESGDLYQNINKIQSIRSKILLIHGEADSIIPVQHSQLMYDKYKQNNPNSTNMWYIRVVGYDHNNLNSVIEQGESSLGIHIEKFIKSVYVQQHANERDIQLLQLSQISELQQKDKSNYHHPFYELEQSSHRPPRTTSMFVGAPPDRKRKFFKICSQVD